MPSYTQAHRALSITTPLGPDALLLEQFRGTEAVSELFHFDLDLLAEATVAFEQLLGQPASVTVNLPNTSGRQFHGLITQLSRGRRVPGAKGGSPLLRYRAVLSPAAWLLTRRVQSRIFQHQTVPEILAHVFRTDWQLGFEARLAGTYPARNYCVQYRESDWAFVSRLMEDEGISYYFRHDDQGHHLVLADHAGAYPDVPQFPAVGYDETQVGVRAAPVVRDWEQTRQLGVYHTSVRDYHFQKPADTLTARRGAAGTVAAGAVVHPLDLQRTVNGVPMLEAYDVPGSCAHHHDGVSRDGGDRPCDLETLRDDLERHARLRQEEETTAQLRIRGASDCGHFLPGHQFRLDRHFDGAAPPGDADRYLLTRVESTASVEGVYTTSPDAQPVYENRFECLPARWPCRPRRNTPRPRIEGPQTATVVGPAGSEVFVDRFGRVKVRFHWDRDPHTGADCSCWVRVAQFWAGKGWGAFFWPRVGHEVVVAFEDGDPDRPLIVGSVYNAVNRPPLELPDYVTITGVKSCIYRGDPNVNFNSVLFYDTPGQEYVHVHSEKNERSHSERHKFHYVPGVNFTFDGDY